MFAKIQNTTVLKYPYTLFDLQNENPYTNFGSFEDLKALYDKTEDAEKNNATLEFVSIDETPSYDEAIQNCVLIHFPILKNNAWVFSYEIIEKTQEEIIKYTQDKLNGTIA